MTTCRMTHLILAMLLALAWTTPDAARAQDYILGENDLLKITVYENEDMTTESRVSGDGMISFPLVGPVRVAGLSVMEAEEELTRLLADGFIIDPHVTVFVKEYRSKKVTILGEVNKPGLYELDGAATIVQIISKAEGLTDKAGDRVLIRRTRQAGPPGEDEVQTISVNLKNLNESGDLSANAQIKDGDRIFVTRCGLVYVTGEVRKPGAYRFEEGMTVIKAIALAEGLTDKAAPGRTSLIRSMDDRDVSLRVEMGYPVRPGDVISVPESIF